jgi:DNA-binding XRE family transcriptional regulator
MSGHRPFSELRARIEADPARKARSEAYARAMKDALRLGELRSERGVTQVEMARQMEVTQANVSRIEHEEDHYLSTLREYVEALGGELQLQAVFPDRTVRLVDPRQDRAKV